MRLNWTSAFSMFQITQVLYAIVQVLTSSSSAPYGKCLNFVLPGGASQGVIRAVCLLPIIARVIFVTSSYFTDLYVLRNLAFQFTHRSQLLEVYFSRSSIIMRETKRIWNRSDANKTFWAALLGIIVTFAFIAERGNGCVQLFKNMI